MVSAARSEFISGLTAFAAACEESAVIAPNNVGRFLRRGMTVAAFNLLEAFLENRLGELAQHVNSGTTQFLDLPDRMQKRSISQTLEVANAKLRRGTYNLTELRTFSSNVGHSLDAVGSAMSLSPFTWLWSGSNVTADDLSSMLSYFQVKQPWDAVREFAGQLGFPTVDADGDNIDFKQDLQALAAERHKAAHLASHPITSLWLRSAPDRILRLAVTLDILVSMGAHMLRTGDSNILSGRKWEPLRYVSFRFVRERGKDYAEFVGASPRAHRVSPDGDRLFAEACGRCSVFEVAVRNGLAGNVNEWSIPTVG